MPAYTLYCFQGHKLELCERFTAPDDDAAVADSHRLQAGRAAELWCEDDHRKVREFAPAAA
jgi:hypothetical protein